MNGSLIMRILLVEDDPMIGRTVQEALKEASYAVDWLKEGNAALTALQTQHYDLMLLDLGLPGRDGMQVLQIARQEHNQVPVLIMTARDGLSDRIKGLDAGADDYVLKPFDMSELLARMRAVWRRHGGQAAPVLSNGILSLDPATHQATLAASGESVTLSNREFALLQALMIRPGAILSRASLEDRVYAWGEEVESNAIEFLIHALRKKLGNTVIKNIRGVGWMVSKNP